MLVVGLIIYLFPKDHNLGSFSAAIQAAHNSGIVKLLPIESFFYFLLLSGDWIVTKIDTLIPFFPSVIRVVWWNTQTISLISLIPVVGLFALAIVRKPRVSLLLFLLFSLWLISPGKLMIRSWDSYVITRKFDMKFPWSQRFVWMNDGNDHNNEYVQYNYSWVQKNKAQKAEITISCLGHYRLSVNNKRIYHGPVFAVLPKVYADTLNIAPFMRIGDNEIEIICLHIDGIAHEYPNYPTSGLLIGGQIEDGILAHNLADNRLWKYTIMQTVKPTERIFDAGYKEGYDLTKRDTSFQVPINREFTYTVLPRPIPLLKYQQISLKEVSSGVYDLGKFSTGYLKIQTKQSKTCSSDIVYGVSLDRTAFPPIYMGQKDSITLPAKSIDWEQISRRSGRYIGFRGTCDMSKVKISFTKVSNTLSLPQLPKDLTPEDEAIFEMSLNSLGNNVQDHIEDSVDRERATYLGDALSVSRCLLTEKGNENIVRQTILQFAESQNSNGSFSSMAPSGLDQFIPSYSLQWASLLEMYLDRTKDREFTKEMWPHLERVMKWATQNESKSGFFTNMSHAKNWWNFFDWTPTSTSLAYQTQNQIWYLRSLEVAAKIAPRVGKDPAPYQKKSIALQKKFWQYAYAKDKEVFVDSFDEKRQDGVSLVTNALAGSLGFFPSQTANDSAITYFQKDYTTDSPYSESWVVDWMIRSGKKDLALQTIRDYWGGMVRSGATSVYEVYKPGVLRPDELNQSYSHAWGCGPVYEYQTLFKTKQ